MSTVMYKARRVESRENNIIINVKLSSSPSCPKNPRVRIGNACVRDDPYRPIVTESRRPAQLSFGGVCTPGASPLQKETYATPMLSQIFLERLRILAGDLGPQVVVNTSVVNTSPALNMREISGHKSSVEASRGGRHDGRTQGQSPKAVSGFGNVNVQVVPSPTSKAPTRKSDQPLLRRASLKDIFPSERNSSMIPPSPTRATPTLPPESDKEIFEIATSSPPLSIPRLMLVAWRVKTWVEPLLYRVLVLVGRGFDLPGGLDGKRGYLFEDDEEFCQIQSIPESVLRDSVRHLVLGHIPAPVTEFILPASSAIENLVYLDLYHNPSPLDILGTLSLKRLSCELRTGIFGSVAHVDFSHLLFSHITHLELFDEMHVVDVDIWSNLALVPYLIHLRLWSPSLTLALIRTCTSLRVLMVVGRPVCGASEAELRELTQDHRFLRMDYPNFVKEW
ncbi:hypothetical protein DFH07DRAFT_941592 [Mycena maculata]|uniref:Uncharacterized protein n=1 Tax=Mycena maculata TaxID=230809 RepID=A0AAD7IW77_9AGAR|nr:hypothetical protein DFH07DRAFT_941592 [Mycena maculata]